MKAVGDKPIITREELTKLIKTRTEARKAVGDKPFVLTKPVPPKTFEEVREVLAKSLKSIRKSLNIDNREDFDRMIAAITRDMNKRYNPPINNAYLRDLFGKLGLEFLSDKIDAILKAVGKIKLPIKKG